jgi:hypothetical protein
MDTTIPNHPSGYAALLTTSSTGAVIGTTVPWSTGLARSGNRLLGNRLGSNECNAVPIVCVCGWDGRPDGVGDVAAAGITGGNVDWITLRDGFGESGGDGRNIRSGMFRNPLDEFGRRILLIR